MAATLASHTDKTPTLPRRVGHRAITRAVGRERKNLSVPAVSVTDTVDQQDGKGSQMALNIEPGRAESPPPESTEPVVIDCEDCAVRGPGCRDCVVSVILGVPETLLEDERAALEVLADAGMAPRLRLVPIHRQQPGVA
jgi:hypothetical protein